MFKELLPSKTSQFSSFHRWKKKWTNMYILTRSCHFELFFLFLFVREFYLNVWLFITVNYILFTSIWREFCRAVWYVCFLFNHIYTTCKLFNTMFFVFLSVVFTIFIRKSGYMLEQEQSEEKYTYIYICTTWLIVLYFYYCNT